MRKSLACLCLAVVSAVVPAAAQEAPRGNLARVTYWTVADADAFEAGVQAHNQFHASLGDPVPIHTFEVVTGPRVGQYIRASFGHTWADFDAEMANLEGDAADSAKNLDPHVTGSVPAIYEALPELSHYTEGGVRPLAKIITFQLKWGHERAFMDAVGKIHAALSEVEGFRPYLWYRLEDGGHVPSYVVSLPSDDWAGFAQPERGIDEIVGEKYGEEAGAIFEAMGSAIESESSYTIAYRSDLSYLPAVPAEAAEAAE